MHRISNINKIDMQLKKKRKQIMTIKYKKEKTFYKFEFCNLFQHPRGILENTKWKWNSLFTKW